MNVFVSSNTFLRHMYSFVMGALLQAFMFKWSAIHVYTMGYGAYFIMNSFTREK